MKQSDASLWDRFSRRKSLVDIVKASVGENGQSIHLKRDLRLVDLTSLAIAAIIGAGIFSTIGGASAQGGPAVSLLFIFTAVACAFSAMCYAEFASRIPISGSAYTYAYASFGELVAWIIGWDLIMEYAVGNIAVAISWSDYFTSLLSGYGIIIPPYVTMDLLSASRGYDQAIAAMAQGTPLSGLSASLQQAFQAWSDAPQFWGVRLIADLPAFGIVVVIASLVYVGIKESKQAANLMVLLKLAVILLIIATGIFYVKPENWTPFAPNGLGGVLKGVSAVFFAYIGFDAISTTAEECKNPQRDLPRAMFLSLIICTVLYVAVCLVLTGMVPFYELNVGDPLLYVFQKVNLSFLSGIIGISAIVAMASVLLVFQIGQPRIWMSMSRDGLLPQRFSRVHPKYHTPSFATLVAGVFVAVPCLFMNLTEVTDLTSIGTLFAFVLVCGGILLLDKEEKKLGSPEMPKGSRFRVPYWNGKYVIPCGLAIVFALVAYFNLDQTRSFLMIAPLDQGTLADQLLVRMPFFVFLVISIGLSFLTFKKNLSFIPVAGLLINLYLMSELGHTNWLRFLIWLAIGLVIYLTYGVHRSKLARR